MKVTADTNVLVRALTEDHPDQSRAAQLALSKAELVALTMPTLCELVWVLRSYKIRTTDIATTIRDLLNASNVAVNRQATEAGLAQLDAGGDFADGVIAYEAAGLVPTLSSRSTKRPSNRCKRVASPSGCCPELHDDYCFPSPSRSITSPRRLICFSMKGR